MAASVNTGIISRFGKYGRGLGRRNGARRPASGRRPTPVPELDWRPPRSSEGKAAACAPGPQGVVATDAAKLAADAELGAACEAHPDACGDARRPSRNDGDRRKPEGVGVVARKIIIAVESKIGRDGRRNRPSDRIGHLGAGTEAAAGKVSFRLRGSEAVGVGVLALP